MIPAWIAAHAVLTITLAALILMAAVTAIYFAYGRSIKSKVCAASAEPQAASCSALRIGNAHHIGDRKSQQDSFGVSDVSNEKLCREKGILAVVADGMGGLSNSDRISAMITSDFLRSFSSAAPGADIPDELLKMTSDVNLKAYGQFMQKGIQSGSTLVAAVVKDSGLYFVSAGDSRIYLLRAGSLIQLNREHTYASELDEKAARGEMTAEQAKNDPQRKALTSYIGMGEPLKTDYNPRPIPLQQHDRVLLMTDGVFGTLTEEEIIASAQADAYTAASQLESLVLSRKKRNQDNFTAIVLECL